MSDYEYADVMLMDPCVYCYGRATGLDHITPRSAYVPGPNSRAYRKWLNSWENRAPACLRCDNTKSSQSLVLFLLRRQREGLPPATKQQAKRARGLVRAYERRHLRSQASTAVAAESR